MKKVRGEVQYAAPCLRPHFIPAQRAKAGAKGAGIRYERTLAKHLSRFANVTHGQWFHYIDDSGPNWCQTDIISSGRKETLVLECKLTWVPEAKPQISELYRPILAAAYAKPVLGVIVCKHLAISMPGETIVDTLMEAIEVARTGRIPTLHWLGKASI